MGDFRKKYPAGEKILARKYIHLRESYVGPLVPRPMPFASRGPSEEVRRFPPVRLGYVTKVS